MGAYSDQIVFRLAWEIWDDLDGYFMGCYDGPQELIEPETLPPPPLATSDSSTQTKPWEPPKAELDAPPTRLVLVKQGTSRPNQPFRPSSVFWDLLGLN